MTDDRHDAVPDRTPPPATGDDGIWVALRRLTAARIGLQRTGASLATGPLLDFQLAHARARDAVHEPLDEARLIADLAGLECPVLAIASAAESRESYLMRPDLGRRLGPGAEAALTPHAADHDVVFVVTGGLSARAVQTHAAPVLAGVLPVPEAGGSHPSSSSAKDGSRSATRLPTRSVPTAWRFCSASVPAYRRPTAWAHI